MLAAAPEPLSLTPAWDEVVLVAAMSGGYALACRRMTCSRGQIVAFAAGQLLILAAFVSPLQTLALHYLLSAHLLQNVVLAEWAPLLIVAGIPPGIAASISRLPGVAFLTHPAVALPLWLLSYTVWHVPDVYDAALRRPETLLHLEHASYFATGLLLWWPVVHRSPRSLSFGARAAYLFAAFALASPIGLMLALIPDAVYDFYVEAPRIWGLSPLADQQIAGVTMAAEQAIVFFALFAYFFRLFMEGE